MRLAIECYPCVMEQVLQTTRLCGLNDVQQREVMNLALILLRESDSNVYPQEITQKIYAHIETNFYSGDMLFDPYRQIKDKTRLIAAEFLGTVRKNIQSVTDSFLLACKLAVLGNIIDFGAKKHGTLDVNKELSCIDQLHFSIDHREELRAAIADSNVILYITDNVGEDIFDRAFIEEINRQWPKKRIVAAAREKPVINDATVSDLCASGLNEVAECISSGSIYPGTILSQTSMEFKSLYADADCIISKGQGNFETLCDEDKPNLFYLLRVKCGKVASHLSVEEGAMIVKKNGYKNTNKKSPI